MDATSLNEEKYAVDVADGIQKLRFTLELRKGAGVDGRPFDLLPPCCNREWTLLEDKLLLKLEENRADVVKGYMLQHRANPQIFPKTPNDETVRTRLFELRSLPRRCVLLRNLPEDGILHSDESLDIPMLVSQLALPRRRVQQNHTQVKTIKDDLIINCATREGSFEGEEVLCNTDRIRAASPFLADVIRLNSEITSNGQRRIVLSERDPMWQSIPHMHSVFAADNIMRFVTFSADPKILSRKQDLETSLAQASVNAERHWSELLAGFGNQKTEALTQIRERADDEQVKLQQAVTSAKEKAIAAISAIYDSHLARELSELKIRHAAELLDTETFYSKELEAVRAARACYEEDEVKSLTGQVQKAQLALEEAFPVEQLPRTLMLADILLCSELRSACIREIRSRIAHFATNRQLSTDLLRANTIRELVTTLPDTELFALVKLKDRCGVPAVFVNEECEKRTASKMTELASLNIVDLANQLAQISVDSIWHNLTYDCLYEKQKATKDTTGISTALCLTKEGVHWAQLDDKRKVVVVSEPYRYVTVRTRGGVHIGESVGHSYWEARIIGVDKAYSCSVSIGFELAALAPKRSAVDFAADRTGAAVGGENVGAAAVDDDNKNTIPNFFGDRVIATTCNHAGKYGCALTNDGLLFVDGGAEDTRATLEFGDVLGVALDELTGVVTFCKNGHPVGLPKAVTVVLAPKFSYVPCATIYNGSPNQRLKLDFEFAGPFRMPVPKKCAPFASAARNVGVVDEGVPTILS